ncbi:hypothetical protein B566_EDAN013021 [Ephemera danica]|nr:hypothetical protein B566_EDAN013021 [Ephemera danica]
MLQAYCTDRHDKWDVHLSSFRFALNSAVHESIGVTPAELTFGDKLVSPLENIYCPRASGEGENDIGYGEYHSNLVDRLDSLNRFIEPIVEKSKARQARNYNKHRRETSCQPGQLVLVREHPLSNAGKKFSAKLADRWGGPFRVIRLSGTVNLVVEDVRNSEGKHRTVHVCDVRPYIERRSDLKEGETALQLVDVCGHGGDEKEPLHSYNLRHGPKNTS